MSDEQPQPSPPKPPLLGKPDPASADWRFAVLVLMVLLIAVLVTGLVLYVQDDSFPEGVGNLASAITGALIVIIGKRMI